MIEHCNVRAAIWALQEGGIGEELLEPLKLALKALGGEIEEGDEVYIKGHGSVHGIVVQADAGYEGKRGHWCRVREDRVACDIKDRLVFATAGEIELRRKARPE